MATTVARLEAVLSAHTKDFDRAMDRSQGKMHKVGKAAALAGTAIFAGLAVTAKVGFDELLKGQKVTAQTNAVLESTGGIARVTAKHVDELSKALLRKSGIDDETIKSGENMLLTFKGIRNETGKGNDIFDQSTKALTDMTVAMNGGAVNSENMRKAAIQLGKAMNDPIAGLTALKRVGVTFTAGQRATIKSLVDSGHTMEAQKIILRELNSEFGGSAQALGQTLPGKINIAKQEFRNMTAELVAGLLPAFTTIIEKAAKMTAWLSAHPKLVKTLAVALGGLATALIAASVAQRLMNLAVLANPYVAATVAILAMGAALVVLWQRSKQARTIIEIVTGVITMGLAPAIIETVRHWGSLTGAMGTAADKAEGVTSRILKAIHGMLKPFGTAISTIITAVSALGSAFGKLWDVFGKIIDGFRWLVGNVKKIGGVFGAITGAVGSAAGALPKGDFTGGLKGGGGTFSTRAAAEGRAFNVGKQLWDEIGMGEQVGLSVTSGYRPGAITKHGTRSDHGTNPSSAVDMAGSAGGMASLFQALLGRREIKQVFYDPLGSIFGGVRSSYREGGHSDHIHIAEYDKGGYLRPGWNLAYNGLGRPEPVGGGDVVIPVSIGGEHIATVIFDQLRRKAKVFENRNGRRAL